MDHYLLNKMTNQMVCYFVNKKNTLVVIYMLKNQLVQNDKMIC